MPTAAQRFTRLDTAFESDVEVVLPGAESPVLGKLSFGPDEGVVLEAAVPAMARSIGAGLEGSSHHPVIYGRLAGGIGITLLDCGMTAFSGGVAGPGRLEFFANQLLIGAHVESEDAAVFRTMRIELDGLSDWIGDCPLTAAFVGEGSKAQYLATAASSPSPLVDLASPLGGPSISLRHSVTYRDSRPEEIVLSARAAIDIRPSPPCALRDAARTIARVQCFLGVLFGWTPPLVVVRLRHVDENVPPCTYVARFTHTRAMPRNRNRAAILTLEDARPSLSKMWSSWWARSDCYETPYQLYDASDVDRRGMLETRFLFSMQAVEALHRSRFGGSYLPTEDFERVKATLTDAIPEGLAPPFRESLRQRLKYSNEWSLRRRLRDLCDRLGPSLCESMHPRLQSLVGTLVDSRNAYTHNDPTSSPEPLRGLELHYATVIVRHLFLASLLTDLGADTERLAAGLRTTRELATARDELAATPARSKSSQASTRESSSESGRAAHGASASPNDDIASARG